MEREEKHLTFLEKMIIINPCKTDETEIKQEDAPYREQEKAEIPAEMQSCKWIVEGKGNGESLVSGDVCRR